MKKFVFAIATVFILAQGAFAQTTATMFNIDQVRPAANGLVTIEALVVFSGESELPQFTAVNITIDLTQTTNQIQSALAAGIRAYAVAQGWTIPVNSVNVMSFTKG